MNINQNPVSDLNQNSSPFDVLAWVKQRYLPSQVVMTTSFGMEGCALINMLRYEQVNATIADIDTGFLFEETRKLREKIHSTYRSFNFETWHPNSSSEEQARDYGDQLWQRDPALCCRLRKVLPLQQNIGRFQVWITAIRKSQNESRQNITPVQWDWQHNILKICPLTNWDRSDVWRYIDAHDVPYNELHEKGYPSISCTNCTRKVDGFVKLTDYSRSGRWSGSQKTECGLHFDNGPGVQLGEQA